MSKGSGSGASGAAQTSANTQSGAFNQIQNLINTTNPQLSSILAPFFSGGSNLAQGAPAIGSFFGSEMAGGVPGLTSFFNSELTGGGGPGFQQAGENAQSQLQQQFGQSLSSIMSNLAPGQNPAAAETQAQNSLLSASTNLGSQLAGQQQGIMQAGAQGLQQQNATQASGAAGLGQLFSGLDSQTLAALQPLLQFFGQSTGALGGIGQTAGNEAVSYTNLANQQNNEANAGWSSLFSGLLGLGTGGLGGGLGSLFGNLFGGGGGGGGGGGLGNYYGALDSAGGA